MTIELLQYLTLDELIDICNTDPAHIARYTDNCAEYDRWINTPAESVTLRNELDEMERDWQQQVAELRNQ